jgi:Ni,Fe-hydrogenase III component G
MDQQEYQSQFAAIEEKLKDITWTTDRRVFLMCESEDSLAINTFLFQTCKLRFTIVTAIDADHTFEVLYHFCDDRQGYVVTVKALIRDKIKPQIQSLAPVIPGAEWIEREVHDLYGIDFINHPNLRRLILSDDWPEGVYPLRKDNKHEEVSI